MWAKPTLYKFGASTNRSLRAGRVPSAGLMQTAFHFIILFLKLGGEMEKAFCIIDSEERGYAKCQYIIAQ